jgi:hypothetical protein
MPAGVNRPSLFICADTPDFPEMTGWRASALAFSSLLEIRAMNTGQPVGFACARCRPSAWMQEIFQFAARNMRHSLGTPLSV